MILASGPVGLGPDYMQPFFNAVNFICRPEILFTGSVAAFFGALKFRKLLVKPPVAIVITVATIAFIGISLMSPQFYNEARKPDNAPIFIMVFLTGLVMWAAFYQAVNNDERFKQGLRSDEHEAAEEKLHVWPYLIYIEAIVAAFVLAALFAWSIALEAPLEQFANPAKSPNPAKAPWYFLGLQEMLVYYDPWIAGVVLPGMILSGLIALPYCDPNPRGVGYYTFEQRRFAITTFLFGFLILWVLLIFVGTFLRGPNWNFFGLYEPWDEHKLLSLNNVNLSEYFWSNLLHKAPPQEWWKREWPGFALIFAYFTILPAAGTVLFKGFYQKLGFVRYSVVVIHLLVMFSLPIKMYLRWSINLKYIVFIPDYFFNI